ncbi:hypothetical protein J2Z37_001804 [Ammoniphilus resinae]|uniref:Uncharacterized protein n=1 Tax=Ammoniphilus resinae TaxID=861532 RepID=A0ABS4GNF2_9BACL|nr:hypothetical protein [Ammoniphilus resinae]
MKVKISPKEAQELGRKCVETAKEYGMKVRKKPNK